ncbi:hypothetical protein CB1_032405003 [Camelus ferus]|nr:hypothetical protein CB1_032405003 [Camelus ferus]
MYVASNSEKSNTAFQDLLKANKSQRSQLSSCARSATYPFARLTLLPDFQDDVYPSSWGLTYSWNSSLIVLLLTRSCFYSPSGIMGKNTSPAGVCAKVHHKEGTR